MSKISNFLSRKSQMNVQTRSHSGLREISDALLTNEPTAERGARLGAENEALRSLFIEATRKIDELDDLKLVFSRLIDPVHKTLEAHEQERSHNASLQMALRETRSAAENLRAQIVDVDRNARALSASNQKLQAELDQVTSTAESLDATRLQLVNDIMLKNAAIADIESRLLEESSLRRAMEDEHRLLSEHAQDTVKRLSTYESEVLAARQKIALADDNQHSLQSSLDEALADVSRLSRGLTETTRVLVTTQARLEQLEANLSETEAELSRLATHMEDSKQRHRTESSNLNIRLDALQSRAATAEKLLGDARVNSAARSDELRASERKFTDEAIARNTAEKKILQLETCKLAYENQIKDVEQARAVLLERNSSLTMTLRTREKELERANEKVHSSLDLIAKLEPQLEESIQHSDKRDKELNSMLERERMDRAVAEGALEANRKENARLQVENNRLTSANNSAKVPAQKFSEGNVEVLIRQ